jgi:outer membrane protein assembly factor BamB
MRLEKAIFVLLVATTAMGSSAVWTQHNDNFRTGAQLNEVVLTPAAVARRGMQVKYTVSLSGDIDAQPLYVRNVRFPDGHANALYVVTENNLVYALDEQTGSQKWTHQLADSDPAYRSMARGSTNPPPTPAIDVSSHTMYVLFSTKNQSVDTADTRNGWISLDQTLDVAYWLVALDIRSGSELRRMRIGAEIKRSDGTTLTFDSRHHVNHPSLLLDHGSIYLAFGSIFAEGTCEYHGWVLRYDAATFRKKGAFSTTVNWRIGGTPDPEGGGIWQGGGGLVADYSGNVYFLVGNAPFDPAQLSYGDAIVKLRPGHDSLDFAGAVAPPKADLMDAKDLDLGSGGLSLIPGTTLQPAAARRERFTLSTELG